MSICPGFRVRRGRAGLPETGPSGAGRVERRPLRSPSCVRQRPGDLSRWWVRLGDPTLTGLIEQALEGSTDLRTAQAQLREARARRGLAGASCFPSSRPPPAKPREGQRGNGVRGHPLALQRGLRRLLGAGCFRRDPPGHRGGPGRPGISEADLRQRRCRSSAEVALNYVEARSFQARLAIAEKNLASQSETLQITDWRNQAGLASSLDVEQARSNLEQTRSKIPVLRTGLAEAENRLAILLGKAPGAVRGSLSRPAPVPAVPEEVATGIPAETLANGRMSTPRSAGWRRKPPAWGRPSPRGIPASR